MDRINKTLVSTFAVALRDARKAAGLTQEELADRAGLSVRFVSLLETGARQPSLSALSALSVGLGIAMSEMMRALETRLSAGGRASSNKP